MRCYSNIVCISYKDHVTNEESAPRSSRQSDHPHLLIIIKRQTEVAWTCLPFIRSGQNHLARHSAEGKKTRQTETEVGSQHQEMEETGCEVICGAPTHSSGIFLVSWYFQPSQPQRITVNVACMAVY